MKATMSRDNIVRLTFSNAHDRMSDYSPAAHADVSKYHIDAWTGPAGEFLREVVPAMIDPT